VTRPSRRRPLLVAALVTLGLTSVAAPTQAHVVTWGPGTYVAAPTPTRVLDTRDGTGGVSAPLGPGGVLTFPTGVPSNAIAVVLNVTAVAPSTAGFLTVYPDGASFPQASSVDFAGGQTTANLVTVGLNSGVVDIFNHSGTTNVLADLQGYYVAYTDGAGFTTTPPTRVLDTRDGTGRGGAVGPVGPNSTFSLAVPAIPVDATAVMVNLTATGGTAPSTLTAYATGSARPATSNLNFDTGQTMANLVVVPVNSRKFSIWNNAGSVDLVGDLVGYYTPESGDPFTALPAQPLYDTLDGTGAQGHVAPLGPNQTATVPLDAILGLPDEVSAVVVHLAVTNATATSFLTAFSAGTDRPNASNIDFTAGQLVSNTMVVPVVNNSIDLWNQNGNVDVVVSVTGYYAPSPQ
jgi:hypothetical protein